MRLRYFNIEDFDCKETGENDMQEDFLLKLDELRHVCRFPFLISSGFRSTKHSQEVIKELPGTHTQGIASDIRVYNGVQRIAIVDKALRLGFTGIGIANSFVHVDTRLEVPTMWTYS